MQPKNTANEEISVEKEDFKFNHSAELVRAGTSSTERSTRFNIPEQKTSTEDDDEAYVEITLDVRDDTVAFHAVKTANGGECEDPEVTLLARNLEKKSSSGSQATRNASSRIKQVSQELKKLASYSMQSGPGRVDRSKSGAAHALKGLRFISKTDSANGWNAVEKRFDRLTKDTGVLDKSLFGQCIGMEVFDDASARKKNIATNSITKDEPKKFARELFDALVRRRNITTNSITKAELKEFWDQISDQSFDSRLQTFFDMVDKNADGRITEEEVKEIISLSASANSLSKIQEQAEEYARLIMEELDPYNLGYIEIYDLETLLIQAPSQSMHVDTGTSNSRNLSRLLSARLKPTQEPNPLRRRFQKAKYFLEDNWQRAWVILLWLSICAGLFTWKFIQYKNRAVFHIMGYCVCTAKGAAETLKFNMALILLPVSRKTITWLRNKAKLGVVVPFNDNLNFHKVIAVGIAIGVGLHAITHLTCDFPRLLHCTDEAYKSMIPFFGDTKPNNYWWFLKGTEGWTGIVMVVLMTIAFTLATPWFRKGTILNLPNSLKKVFGGRSAIKQDKGTEAPKQLNLLKPFKKIIGFNAFWYSHHLFVIVYILLIIHGFFLYLSHGWHKKTTWMYLAVPVLLYGTERLLRAFRSSSRPVKILKVALYPGNVLALHVSKPQGFNNRSGQYIFVNCAAVSPFQWHPFSITSAPQDDYVSVHIRILGDWTSRLRAVFSDVCQPAMNGSDGNGITPVIPKILIDGPCGAPAQDYKNYEVVLLVGQGIGATPFISIIKDIINNMKQLDANDIESGTNNSNDNISNTGKRSSFKTRRAYFYWVTREQGSFQWFRGVMNEVAETDKKGAIELHNYCTSVYEEGDARSALITMLQSLNHAKNGVDVVSGTRVKSHFARPNWRNVYKRIALNHNDQRVGVFYCGAPVMAKELRNHAQDFSRKTATKFEFHKENF